MERLSSKPPYSNTGVNRTKGVEVGFDYLAGSLHCDFSELLARCEKFLSEQFVKQEHGTKWYREIWRSPSGAKLYRLPVAAGSHHGLSFSGAVVGRFNPVEFLNFIVELVQNYGFKASRIDIRLDDYDRRLSLDAIGMAARSGNFYGLRRWADLASGERGKGNVGRTVTFGSRGEKGSGKYQRFYDKFVESLGKIDAIRCEAEFTGKQAQNLVANLVLGLGYDCDPGVLAGLLRSLCCGLVDFRQRDASGRKDRSVRFDWWEEFLDGNSPVRLSLPVVVRTLEQKRAAFEKQYASMFAVFVNSQPDAQIAQLWIHELIHKGECKMNEKHHALVNAARMVA